MLGSASTWVSKFEDLGTDSSPAWSGKMAGAVAELTNGTLDLIEPYAGGQFSFSKGTFASGLESIGPSTSASGSKFAGAWADAMSASSMQPPPIGPGFSIITTATVEPESVASAKASLAAALDSNPPGPDARVAFASAFRTAFASVTYKLEGMSTGDPSPMTVPKIGTA